MRVEEMRELTRDELLQKKRDFVEEQFNLRMRKSFKELDNPLRLRQLRREMARINTVLREDDKGIRALAQSKTSILDQADSGSQEKK